MRFSDGLGGGSWILLYGEHVIKDYIIDTRLATFQIRINNDKDAAILSGTINNNTLYGGSWEKVNDQIHFTLPPTIRIKAICQKLYLTEQKITSQ